MRILILGGDGYLGWPTAMYLSRKGHTIAVVDNFFKRQWEIECGISPLIPIPILHERIQVWKEVTENDLELYIGDLTNGKFVYQVIEHFMPEAIVHYGEQPSAPFSMMDRHHAVFTQVNNITGTLNVLFAMKKYQPTCHLVKLGTMGEYGTPNIDIEEGFIEISHNGRKDMLPFPKQAGSFYHLSKVHDSHNIMFACKTWGLHATDLNQGIVYGIDTDETKLDERLITSFHYDEIFGTALNRFCVQVVSNVPLTVYGKGGQRRGFLNIMDTLQCVELAIINPSSAGEYRVFNQFTEVFSIAELAGLVKETGRQLGLNVKVDHISNPRIEKEEHYYNPAHTKLTELGLRPRLLSDVLLEEMMKKVMGHKNNIKKEVIIPTIKWRQDKTQKEKAVEKLHIFE